MYDTPKAYHINKERIRKEPVRIFVSSPIPHSKRTNRYNMFMSPIQSQNKIQANMDEDENENEEEKYLDLKKIRENRRLETMFLVNSDNSMLLTPNGGDPGSVSNKTDLARSPVSKRRATLRIALCEAASIRKKMTELHAILKSESKTSNEECSLSSKKLTHTKEENCKENKTEQKVVKEKSHNKSLKTKSTIKGSILPEIYTPKSNKVLLNYINTKLNNVADKKSPRPSCLGNCDIKTYKHMYDKKALDQLFMSRYIPMTNKDGYKMKTSYAHLGRVIYKPQRNEMKKIF